MLWESIAYLGVLVGLVGFAASVAVAVIYDRHLRNAHPQYRRYSR